MHPFHFFNILDELLLLLQKRNKALPQMRRALGRQFILAENSCTAAERGVDSGGQRRLGNHLPASASLLGQLC